MRFLITSLILGLLAVLALPSEVPWAPPVGTIHPRLELGANLQDVWQPVGARLRGNLVEGQARAQLKYIGETPVQASRFYGEYFDARGRRCFTLIFGFGTHEDRNPVWVPGQARFIGSITSQLWPASEPTRLVISKWAPLPGGAAHASEENLGRVDAPPTLRGYGSDLDWEKIWLGPEEIAKAKKPILDMVLARVSVGSDGKTEAVQVLNLLDSNVETWFENFMPHLKWRPALRDGKPAGGDTLLLIQVGVVADKYWPALPWTSPWVQAYVSGIKSADVPVVNEILLDPEGGITEAHPHDVPAPGFFQYNGMLALWSQGPTDGLGHWSK